MTSIRRTLNLRQAAIQILLCGLVAFAVYRFVENRLLAEFDRNLQTLAKAGTGTVEIEEKRGRTEIEIESEYVPAYDRGEIVFFLRNPEGRVRLNPDQADLDNWSLPPVGEDTVRYDDWPLPDGRRGRSGSVRFHPEVEDGAVYEGGDWFVTVIRDRHSVDQALATVLWGCVGLGSAAVLLSLLANYWSIGKGLRPLDRIGQEVTELGPDNLNHRLSLDGLPGELQPVGSKLNELLERLERAFQRERFFTGNAAHELRTPLAELQTILQVGERWRPEHLPAEDPARYFADGAAIAKHMGELLDTLFAVARQSSPDTAATENLDLTEALSRHIASRTDAAPIRLEGPAPLPVRASRGLLIASFSNLLDNALVHGNGPIRVESFVRTSHAGFRVTNPAPELEPEDLAHVRDPFWRKDAARSDRDRLGLGLNLVETYCQTQSWRLELGLDDQSNFWVEVSEILLAPASSPPSSPLQQPDR